jgi:membrane protease YdiL (CAAX protease family)
VVSWSTGSPSRRAAILIGGTLAAALAGAFLFGAWHVLYGGLVKGNWRAGGFGVALAAVCALLLGAEAALLRRRLRG